MAAKNIGHIEDDPARHDGGAEAARPTSASASPRPGREPRKRPVKKRWTFKGWSTPTPLLSEMMGAIDAPAPLKPDERLLESGVLAYRRQKNGKPRILLISRKRSKSWGIPKGKLEPHLSFAENAAKEAFEEAGVIGYVSPNSVGMFRAKKRRTNSQTQQVIEVWIYLLEVTKILSKWPEQQKRQTKWVSCQKAARYLRELTLIHLCHRLAQN